MKPVPDFPVGWFAFYIESFIVLVILNLLIIWLEAGVLKRLEYGSFGRCFRTSLAMNVVSAALGFITAATTRLTLPSNLEHMATPVGVYYARPREIRQWFLLGESRLLPNSRLPAMLLFLLLSWVVSVLIEGGVMMLMRRDVERRRIWEMALLANVASYVLLFGLYILAVLNLGGFDVARLHRHIQTLAGGWAARLGRF